MSKPELGNLVTALDLLERQMADKPILPNLPKLLRHVRHIYTKKYDVDKLKREDKERQTKEAKEKNIKETTTKCRKG
ncbi:hypothetical protein [Secundilactobacillus odoratitofui]|uniref:hypothetical protein n=1 Tax=Secundilactobacillus odoratitofui TaxID=480930 RepID=UPI0006D12DD4|nr:hypothetical protein [Secundilactobacillus odoratitofui]